MKAIDHLWVMTLLNINFLFQAIWQSAHVLAHFAALLNKSSGIAGRNLQEFQAPNEMDVSGSYTPVRLYGSCCPLTHADE